ncbi:cation transporter [Lacrimispora sp.]|uniref:cation transporter n=1 Tax=Lacrimispora sp. TaxID=2719234 RepID=UPI002FD8C8DC
MTPKKREHFSLVIGIAANLLMGAAGLSVYFATGIEALFLDAMFTLVTVLSGIAAAVISKRSKYTSEIFPHGLFVLEPIYVVFKSLLMIFLIGAASISVSQKAIAYFISGTGEKMLIGPIIPYELIMVVLCGALFFFYRTQNNRIGNTSILLKAETKSTMVDGLMSGGIGLAAFAISFIDNSSPLSFLLYTGDFFITILLVLFSIKEPFILLREAFIEIADGVVTKDEIKAAIEDVIRKNLPQSTQMKKCLIHKIGMSLRVIVLLNGKDDLCSISELHEKALSIEKILSGEYGNAKVSFVFS